MTIFGDMIRRSYKPEFRKEDDPVILFKNSRENPEEYYVKDGLVCCNGSVTVLNDDLVDGKFPVKFGKVQGNFDCAYCESLTSLEGAPKEVGKNFYCSECSSLASLEGAPEKVGGDFDCTYCSSLTSLKGITKNIGGKIYSDFE